MKKLLVIGMLLSGTLVGQTPYQLSPDRYENGMPPSVFSKEFLEDVCKVILKDNYIVLEREDKKEDKDSE